MDCLAYVDQGLKTRVAIVGGGWAGLAAAVELCSAGIQVTVFEAARQLGGRARRVDIRGHALDNGQHILIGAYGETLRLMRRIGADPERLLKRVSLDLNHPAADFHLRLPKLPAPLHLAWGLLTASGATLSEKISAVRFMRALQARDYRLASDATVSELLDRHGQRGMLRRLMWEPLCLAALNTAPENASAQIFANVLRDSLGGTCSDTDLLLPAADLNQVFPEAAAAFITAHGGAIHLAHRVERIDTGMNIDGENFDHLILAVAPQHAVPLLSGLAETRDTVEMLAGYAYEPIGTAFVAYPQEVCLPSPMLGLESASNGHLGQWAFDRGQLCGDPGIISFVLSANGHWDEQKNETLVATLHQELETALDKRLPHPLWYQVLRERRATFSCRPGLPRPEARTARKGLWLAGDYVCADYPATLEGAVRSGTMVVRAILSS